MSDRGERRARTLRVCEARLRLKKHHSWWEVDWEAYREEWKLTQYCYAKDRPYSCRCSKHSKGNPKIGHGICNCGYRYRVLGLRHVARQVRDLARRRNIDWESDAVEGVFAQRAKNRW